MQVELDEKKQMRQRVAKPMLWVGIVSITMVFAALTSAYIVRQSNGEWLTFDMPQPFFISTVFLVLSSITMWLAQQAVKRDALKRVTQYVLLTLLLGVGFVAAQIFTYDYMVDQGYYFTGTSVSSSFLYVITGLHALHLISGIIALLVTYVKARQQRYSSSDYLGLSLTATYWHFLDVLWVYLLLFLLFIR